MTFEAVSAGITAIGVFFAALQLKANRKLAQTEFEDSLDAQYRSIMQRIPADVLLGKSDQEMGCNSREMIYNYLDLSNEQIHLRKLGRITKTRWTCWCEGIQDNLKLVSFGSLWQEIKECDQINKRVTFSMLTKLEETNFKDPREWR